MVVIWRPIVSMASVIHALDFFVGEWQLLLFAGDVTTPRILNQPRRVSVPLCRRRALR